MSLTPRGILLEQQRCWKRTSMTAPGQCYWLPALSALGRPHVGRVPCCCMSDPSPSLTPGTGEQLVLTDQEENVFDHRAPASCASKPPFVLQGDAQSLDSQTIRMFKGPVQQQRLCLRNPVLVILHSWDSRCMTLVFRKQKAWGWNSDKPWKCSLAP